MRGGVLQATFLYIVLAGLLVLAFFILRPFLVPLALAAVFATVLYPVYLITLRRIIKSPNLAALGVALFGLLIISIPLAFVGTRIVHEAQDFYRVMTSETGSLYINNAVEYAYEWSGNIMGRSDAPMITTELNAYVGKAVSWLVQNLGGAFSSVAALVADLLIFCMARLFLLRDGESLKRAVVRLSPLKDIDDELVFSRLRRAVNSVVRGSLLVAVVQGLLTGTGFTLFGISNGVLWGTVAMISALIPGVGTSLVIIPGVLYLFAFGHTASAIGLLLWGIVAVGLIDNFLGPKLMGSGMQLHPLFILLFVIGGIGMFGPAGIFLGPLCLSLLFAFLSIYADTRDKNMFTAREGV